MLDYVYNESFDWNKMFVSGKLAEFDFRKAGIAACLARDSYYNDKRYGQTLTALGFRDIQFYSEKDLEAFAGCLNIKLYGENLALIPIVFRGSDEVRDWLRNIDVRMTRFLNTERFPGLRRIEVHNGIFDMVHDFEKKANRIIFEDGLLDGTLFQILRDESKRKKCFFWIIGHSLGGAMATLFAARLLDYYGVDKDRILTHTFGAPPVGNGYFARRYGQANRSRSKVSQKNKDLLTVFRFVNAEDPIPAPRFPDGATEKAEGGSIIGPPYHLLGFRHFGQDIQFSPRFLPGFYDKYQAFTGRRYNSSQFMKVHFMDAYMTAVDIIGSIESLSVGGI